MDVDEGQNAVLFYNLSAADPHFFIDNDGRINSAEPLKANEVYHLIVKVLSRWVFFCKLQGRAMAKYREVAHLYQ